MQTNAWHWSQEKIALTIMAANLRAGRPCPVAALVLARMGV